MQTFGSDCILCFNFYLLFSLLYVLTCVQKWLELIMCNTRTSVTLNSSTDPTAVVDCFSRVGIFFLNTNEDFKKLHESHAQLYHNILEEVTVLRRKYFTGKFHFEVVLKFNFSFSDLCSIICIFLARSVWEFFLIFLDLKNDTYDVIFIIFILCYNFVCTNCL